MFQFVDVWLETGLMAPRTSLFVEILIRELVRTLKKVGWNWSDHGATRMGRIVMIRRYARDERDRFWRERLNLRGRCTIQLVRLHASNPV